MPRRPRLRRRAKSCARIEKLINLEVGLRTVLVVGCGPRPDAMQELLEMGYLAAGVEPVVESADAAREVLGSDAVVGVGCAEALPFDSASQRVVLMESVFEHVDSPEKSLAEAFRVLIPGGILFIMTTNRWRLSLSGENYEFNVPFYNWFPAIVKECYVHEHLHTNPALANYTPRPAVHWFSYPDLCRLGRTAGFARFYSLLDVLDATSPRVAKSGLRKRLFAAAQRSAWLRALALTQVGGSISCSSGSQGTNYPSSILSGGDSTVARAASETALSPLVSVSLSVRTGLANDGSDGAPRSSYTRSISNCVMSPTISRRTAAASRLMAPPRNIISIALAALRQSPTARSMTASRAGSSPSLE